MRHCAAVAAPDETRVSSRAASAVTASAASVTTAATQGSASSGTPCDSATPPSHAPPALPTLNAPMFSVDARFGACAAFSTTRDCSGGTVAKAAIPQTNTVTAAAAGMWLVFANAAITAISATRIATSEGISARSASRPPIVLPIVSPAPNSASTSDTARGAKPVTSSRIGAM
ncbi:major facilitator superfamily MFS_1 domain protein [Burkholderia pseudomallei]|nr:major facilitator superfamily MFS_1 domain protein [Burkholderia pseudomallei]